MGLFSRVRRAPAAQSAAALEVDAAEPLAVPAAEPPEVEPTESGEAPAAVAMLSGAPTPRTSGAGLSTLREGLQQIYAIRPSREAFAEEAIKLIARATSLRAAALLSYEARGGRMQLAAHVGLESDAVHVLSGDAMMSAWDIPVRSIRNRRINVIEAAHENPFVPRPLAAISPRRLTIAALPFFHANAPVGVVVLFSPTPRGFADGVLKTLSQALRVCAVALSELPPSAAATARAVEQEATPSQPTLLRGLAALKSELARLTAALEESERLRAGETAERVTAQSFLKVAQDRAVLLDKELAQLRVAHAALPAIEEQAHDLSRRLAMAAEAADAAQTQVDQLQAAVADLTPRAARAGELQTALAAADAARTETEAVIARLRQEVLASHDQRSRAETGLEQTSAALAAREQEHAALSVALDAARAELASLAQVQQELTALRDMHASVEAALAAQTHELETTRTTLTSDGQQRAAAAEAARVRVAELEAERTGLESEGVALRDALTEREAALVERAAALAALQAEFDEFLDLATQSDGTQAAQAVRLAEIEGELAETRAAGERLAAELAAGAEAQAALTHDREALRTRVAVLAAGGESLEQERQTTVAAAQQRTAALEAEVARLAAILNTTRASAADEIMRGRHDAEATLDGLRVDLAEAARARDELQRALAAAQQEGAAQQRALAEMAAERARLEAAAERLRGEHGELSAHASAAAAEHAALADNHGAATTRLGALEAELRSVRDEQLVAAQAQLAVEIEARRAVETGAQAAATAHADELAQVRDQLAALGEEETRLAHQLAERDLLLQSAEENLGVLDLQADDVEDADAIFVIERDAAPAGTTAVDAEAFAEADAAEAGELLLLDAEDGAEDAARQLLEFGHRVSALAPTIAAADQCKQRRIAGAAVNLATPPAWGVIRHMRNGSGIPYMPLVGYALTSGQPKGFWLGPVDFAILPVAQLDIAAALSRLVPKLRRVLAMSNDIDVMSDVRLQLTAAGVSTAVVLDGRQALDLVPTIRPEAAVLHLSPSCVDVFRAIAGLRAADISREVPILFLLDAEPQPREEAFLSAGVRMLTSRGGLAADGLVETLAAAFDGCRM